MLLPWPLPFRSLVTRRRFPWRVLAWILIPSLYVAILVNLIRHLHPDFTSFRMRGLTFLRIFFKKFLLHFLFPIHLDHLHHLFILLLKAIVLDIILLNSFLKVLEFVVVFPLLWVYLIFSDLLTRMHYHVFRL